MEKILSNQPLKNQIKILFCGNINKYEKILLLRNLLLKLIYFCLFFGVILYLSKFQVYPTTPDLLVLILSN